MTDHYDVIVLGGGAPGEHCAGALAEGGLRVAVVERDLVGGLCTYCERLWAVGDVTGIWQLTHVGEYQGELVASNILGEPREAHYEAVPRVTYTDPQAASVGATEAEFTAAAQLAEIAKTATSTHAYAESNGFLTLLSDGERITGAYALGPEAGEWMQQATLAIRVRVPLEVVRDTIQPFPSFSEIHATALKALRQEIAAAGSAVGVGLQ